MAAGQVGMRGPKKGHCSVQNETNGRTQFVGLSLESQTSTVNPEEPRTPGKLCPPPPVLIPLGGSWACAQRRPPPPAGIDTVGGVVGERPPIAAPPSVLIPLGGLVGERARVWPLHDIVITNIVWCMA